MKSQTWGSLQMVSIKEAVSKLEGEERLTDDLINRLQTCRQKNSLGCAKDASAYYRSNALEMNRVIENHSVPLLVDAGSARDAQQVFRKSGETIEYIWTSSILASVKCEEWQRTLDLYQNMHDDNVHPSTYTFVAVLKACAMLKSLNTGSRIHVEILSEGFEGDLHVGRSLLSMYVKCGALRDAYEVFEELLIRNIVSWNVLISGYVEHGSAHQALKCFEQMQIQGVSPDAVTITSILKACNILGAIDEGRKLYLKHVKEFDWCISVANTVIGMFAKHDCLKEAQAVFNGLPARDVVSWTTLIAGYAEHGQGQEAINCYQNMQADCISPNNFTYSCVLKACSSIGALNMGLKIQSEIAQEGFNKDLAIGNSLIDMYGKCGSLVEAQDVLDELLSRDVVSWTALCAGYQERGLSHETLNCFEQMQSEGTYPDDVTFTLALKACSSLGAIKKGKALHAEIAREGLDISVSVNNTLIAMYAKCGSLPEAWDIFDNLSTRNVVSWTALIAGYAEDGPSQEVLDWFNLMIQEGITPSEVTFTCALKACSNIGDVVAGSEIHREITMMGLENDPSVLKTLVAMYAKCGFFLKAREVFNKLPLKDVTSWTALIAGHVDHGSSQEGLDCFEKMHEEGMSPNSVTYLCILKTCGCIGSLKRGHELHNQITSKGYDRDAWIGNSLISMYSNCGSLFEAREVFDKLAIQDVIAWSSMIKGYALNYEGSMAMQCFKDMQAHDVAPDAVTFVCLLAACSHVSLVSQGQQIFESMRRDYKISPTGEHYTCFVDLLARAGHLCEAGKMVEMMEFPTQETWLALLSACKVYGKPVLGLRCFQQLVQMNPKDATWYVIMTDIYIDAGKWQDAFKIEEMRTHAGADKMLARSLIELDKVHEFVLGYSRSNDILAMLGNLSVPLKENGFVPDLNSVKFYGYEQHPVGLGICQQ